MPIYKLNETGDDDTDGPLLSRPPRRFSLGSKIKSLQYRRNRRKVSYDPNLSKIDSKSPLSTHKCYGNEIDCLEERIPTRFGRLLVARQGAKPGPRRSIIVTYHDLGLNYISNFEGFFSLSENCPLLASFTVYHINAPGAEAERLPDGYKYPTMDQLATQINDVLDYYKIKSFIGIGSGIGANILTRFALVNPAPVEGLFLVNANCSQSSWKEWFWTKRHLRSLLSASQFLPESAQEYLLWYHFGNDWRTRSDHSRDIIDTYRSYFKGINLNPYNLALLLEAYVKRTPLPLSRSSRRRRLGGHQSPLKCQLVLVTGSQSPHLEATIFMNSRLDPGCTTWLKIDDCAMVLEEKPHKVAQALHLFFQGLGYPLKDMVLKRARLSGLSLPSIMGTSLISIPSIPSVPSTPLSPISAHQIFFS